MEEEEESGRVTVGRGRCDEEEEGSRCGAVEVVDRKRREEEEETNQKTVVSFVDLSTHTSRLTFEKG